MSSCAVLGDILKPTSFAGLFGAASSVALATLGLTILTNGRLYAAKEGRSMIAGAIALALYAGLCSRLMMRHKLDALPATVYALALRLTGAVGRHRR